MNKPVLEVSLKNTYSDLYQTFFIYYACKIKYSIRFFYNAIKKKNDEVVL